MLDPQLLAAYLPRQRWFGAKDRTIEGVEVTDLAVLRSPFPLLVRALLDVRLKGADTHGYQLLLGVRPPGEEPAPVRAVGAAILGEIDTAAGRGLAYDALLDPELCLALLQTIAPAERASDARPAGVEQSNSSVIYDDRLILKVFRRLAAGPNPDVEVTTRLAEVGFRHVAEPVAAWRHGGRDLAFLQRFLAGGKEGWARALASLRQTLTARGAAPGDAGDFAPEAGRLGAVTAALHVALAKAFGRSPGYVEAWAAPMQAQLGRTRHPELSEDRVRGLLDRLRSVPDTGAAIRIHGDYHLGQVLRAADGWYVLDFEGEPGRPIAERQAPVSPLKDVAGMLRSFHYASQVALREAGPLASAAADAAAAWETRCRQAFLDSYLGAARSAGLLPADEASCRAVLAAFELDKAVYELAYEMANRPEWVNIPLTAIRRILEAG